MSTLSLCRRMCGLLLPVSGRIIGAGALLWLAQLHASAMLLGLAVALGFDATLAGLRWAARPKR
jgi:hypothetical protein